MAKTGEPEKPEKPKTMSKSAKLDLTLPISRVQHKLKATGGTKRVGASASVYLTAVLDYVASEILENATQLVSETKRKTISPEIMLEAVRSDPELSQVYGRTSVLIGDNIGRIERRKKKKAA